MTHRDIIDSINFKIENSRFERFKIEQIINELNNTYRDLANKTAIFETHDYMSLEDGNIEYTLPERLHRPTRAVYRGKTIDFVSQEAMDFNHSMWETETTPRDLKYLVYNNMSDRRIKPYPILMDVKIDIPTSQLQYLGELSGVADNLTQHLWVNLVTGAKYLSEKPFGTISDFNFTEVVTIYGAYLPDAITEIDLDRDDIAIDEIYVNALIYGTAGNLLVTSGRTEDITKAQNFLKIYGIQDTEVSIIKDRDFSGGFRNTARQNYRTPFDN